MWSNTYWWVKALLFVVVVVGGIGIYNLLGKPGWPDGSGEIDVTGDPVTAMDADAQGIDLIAVNPAPPTAMNDQTVETLTPQLEAVHQKLALARQQMEAGKLTAARGIAENTLRDPSVKPYAKTWYAATGLVNEINAVFMTSSAPCPEKVKHIVGDGDSLWSIARKYNTTVPFIQKINGMNSTNETVMAGQTLDVFQAQWRIEVSKTHFLLVVYNGDRVMRTFPVGIGKQDRTPVGTFMMVDKVREPPWTNKGRVIPYGDPENVLGTRWMKIEPTGDTNPNLRGYGIHGTWEPDSIGTAASNGCIRMENAKVEELFDLLPANVPVTIFE